MSYYAILGLSDNSSLDEIKKAYKKMSLKHHPDVTGIDSTEDFIKIKEAYDFLIKNHKETVDKAYDTMWSDMFRASMRTPSYKQVHSAVVRCSLEEAISGFERELNLSIDIPCRKCSVLTRSICNSCGGSGFNKEYKTDTFIFNSITSQDQYFIYKSYCPNVNLSLRIKIIPPDGFSVKGKNVESVQYIDIFKAIIGGEYVINTVEGEETVILPEGNITDYVYVLSNRGLSGGNYLIKLKVILSKKLTCHQKVMLNNILYDEKNDEKAKAETTAQSGED